MKIKVERLTKCYSGKQILDDLNFSIGNNETVAIVGPNGAGKTTLLEILMTLRSFTGNIEMMGEKMDEKHLSQIRSKIGVIFQEGGMYAYLKVREILDLFASFYTNVDNRRIEEVIELFNLSSHLSVKFQNLSGGWKQRVLLSIAFLHHPELLFLDEPTTGLDPEATQDLWEAVKIAQDEGATILLSTHSMEEIDLYADRVLILSQSKILAFDTPNAIKEACGTQYFKDAYFKLIKHKGEKNV